MKSDSSVFFIYPLKLNLLYTFSAMLNDRCRCQSSILIIIIISLLSLPNLLAVNIFNKHFIFRSPTLFPVIYKEGFIQKIPQYVKKMYFLDIIFNYIGKLASVLSRLIEPSLAKRSEDLEAENWTVEQV